MSGHSLAVVSLAAATLVVGVPSPAVCQGTSAQDRRDPSVEARARETEKIVTARNIDVDLTVPESPAFTALGLSPETIVRPTTPREFATALLNGVDRKGHLQTGVAVDAAPYLVFAGSGITLGAYRTSTVTRVLSRTVVSFATTRGATSEDPSVRLGLGVHATLYDSQDPRMNDALLDCYGAHPVFRPVSPLPINDDPTIREAEAAKLEKERQAHEAGLKLAVDACQVKFRLPERWNGTSWIVAVAPTWTSSTGLAKDIESGSVGIWTSVSYGFDGVPGLDEKAQLIAHARYLSDEIVVDKNLPGGQEVRDTMVVGARLRAGTSTFNFSFEGAYLRTAAAGRPNDTAARLSFAAERRLADNLWLTVSFGGDRGNDQGPDRGMSLLSAFKWGIAKNPALSPQQLAKLQ
jgi:hypothetical protein